MDYQTQFPIVKYFKFLSFLINLLTFIKEEFFNYFSKFGCIDEFSIMHDKNTGNSRGFGFVIFKHRKSVELVLMNKNSHCIRGKWIDCKPAFPRQRQKDEKKSEDDNDCHEFNNNCKILIFILIY